MVAQFVLIQEVVNTKVVAQSELIQEVINAKVDIIVVRLSLQGMQPAPLFSCAWQHVTSHDLPCWTANSPVGSYLSRFAEGLSSSELPASSSEESWVSLSASGWVDILAMVAAMEARFDLLTGAPCVTKDCRAAFFWALAFC